MIARNGVLFVAVPVAFALVALGLFQESHSRVNSDNFSGHARQDTALAPFLNFGRTGRNHADATVRLNIPATTAGPPVPITVSTTLPDARSFCVDVDLNHDGRFEGPGELAYSTGRLDEAGAAEMRLHGLIHGHYRARARVDGIHGEVVSAIQKFELSPPRNSHLPVSFEVNKGQTDSSVLFLGRAKNQMVFVTAEETVIRNQETGVRGQTATRQSRFRLVGANSWAQPMGQKKLAGKANYFIGNDPRKWRTDIETYHEVVTRDVYPGIDLVYHSSQGRLQYDFRVAPGADLSVITLEFPDVTKLAIRVHSQRADIGKLQHDGARQRFCRFFRADDTQFHETPRN
ncbi:MAG: hypothetical protein EXS16_10780 [Gemmataceae bacterium]|nr:hypothetical protein [Gemmataceae bacterium]